MTPEECKSAIRQNLSDSITHAMTLKEILDVERLALGQRDTVSLNETATQKRAEIRELDTLDHGRREIGIACGFELDSAHFPQLIEWCDPTEEIASSWVEFLDIARQCSDMNNSNGAIIRVRQLQIKDAIVLLRDGAADGFTYGPEGHHRGELGTRSLAEA